MWGEFFWGVWDFWGKMNFGAEANFSFGPFLRAKFAGACFLEARLIV